MQLTQQIIDHFKSEEGYDKCAYKDHLGYPTIGIGCLLIKSTKPEDWDKYKNLCWTDKQVMDEFATRFNSAVKDAMSIYPDFDTYSDNVKLAIVDNVYQMGIGSYSTFVNSIKLIKAKQWNAAADNLLKSKWATQTPARAKRITDMIRKG
jgi:GH24 family phage-related lysozyme (muramidase)